MANYVVQDTQLTSVANAIRTKGGTSAQLEWPQGYIDAVDAITTGGGSASAVAEKTVNFRDYDGTCVYSYTADEFAALTAMPDNPDHSHDAIPLTSQGWNWSLENAQAYVAKHGQLEIGQLYITTDGKTHILIHLEKGRTNPRLGCCPDGTVDVDWGDGTKHDTLTGTSVTTMKWTPNHEYAAPGNYIIQLTVTGSMGFNGSSSSNQYSGLLRYTTAGDGRNHVYQNAIQSVKVGRGVTSIGTYAFHSCYNLSSISIPDSVTSIMGFAFYCCYSLSNISIPNGVTSILGNVFDSCHSLSSISIPDSVTNIGTGIFSKGYSLSNISIPDGVTSIGSGTFQNCHSLSNISIPNGVTSILGNTFNNCYGISEYHFASTTPPTLSNTNAFTSIAADCIIYVPHSEDHSILEAYKTATNWSTYASHMQEEPQA